MQTPGQNPQECPCLAGEPHDYENTFIGVDSDFGEVSVARCKGCIGNARNCQRGAGGTGLVFSRRKRFRRRGS